MTMRRTVSFRLGAGLAAAGLCAFLGARGLDAQGFFFQQPEPAGPPIHQSDDPILKSFVWRSIGPANIGGRVDDIAVVDGNPSTFYVGFATGGVWKTTNNGTTWTPIFQEYPVASIGDIAIAPSNPDVIYVGTGEPNNRQSASFGAGVYKSIDGGKKFEYVGLKETQSIARIVVSPKDPNVAYVAAVGHLFGPNAERGLFKTTDGGKTWTNTKFIDNDTGFTDVVMDPANPNVLFAASYQRRRTPWGFNGGGPGSGIWKTTDAGRTWTKLTGSGLPTNPIIGRIGLDIARSHPQTIYASIEVGAERRHRRGRERRRHTAEPLTSAARGGSGGRGQQPPPPPDPNKSGDLAVGRCREDVEVPVELDGPADVLQPDPRRSDEPRDRVPGRRAVLQDGRRRQDVDAGAGASAQRPPRDLDRPARPQPPAARQRRRHRRHRTIRPTRGST